MFCKRAVNDSLYSCTSGGHRVEGDGGEKYLSFSNLPQSPQIYRCLGCLKIWSAFPGEVVNGTKRWHSDEKRTSAQSVSAV
jgi:hypothetical protein